MQKVLTGEHQLGDYNTLVCEGILSEIGKLADSLKGLHVVHVNATPKGGGVAEILNSLIPLSRGVGIDAEWYAIPPDESFVAMTKGLHHYLQGSPGYLTEEQMRIYLAHNQMAAEELQGKSVVADVWVVHDPQVLPLADFLPSVGKTVWNCHIDTTHPNAFVRDILMPFISRYDRIIFTLEQYVFEGLSRDKVSVFSPAIDPLSPKNLSIPIDTAKQALTRISIDPTRRLITQVSRFDRWKDPWGVIDAYRLAGRNIPDLQLALVGDLAAQDDPDAQDVLRSVQEYAGNDPDIHLFADRSVVADQEVNAFQTASDVVVQKSLREGFGLTIAEAMWKGTPVVGGNCGGVRLQIRHGETGFLVSNAKDCAARIVTLLETPDLARGMGQAGKEFVRQNFLMPRLLRDHLRLYALLVQAEDHIWTRVSSGEGKVAVAVS